MVGDSRPNSDNISPECTFLLPKLKVSGGEERKLSKAVSSAEEKILRPGLVAAQSGDWVFWRQIGLRGAGFPARLVRELSFPHCAAAAAESLAAESQLEVVRTDARQRLDAALDALRQEGRWGDAEARRDLLDGLRAINKGRIPKGTAPVLDAVAELIHGAESPLRAAQESFHRIYEEAVEQQSAALRRFALREDFQRAVLWQNRAAFHTALKRLANPAPGQSSRNSQRRQYEELVASYVQRYTVKNDTIGFFGPMGWAHFGDGEPAIEVRPGARFLSDRQVFLETWCFEELAKALALDGAARPWMVPRRAPLVRLSGATLHLPLQQPIRLTPARAAVLIACDGTRLARDIAADLVADSNSELKTDREVYLLLEHLQQVRLVEWSFYVPVHPEAGNVLRQQVQGIGDSRVQRLGLAALDAIEDARQAVASSEDLANLDRALGELDAAFTRNTGVTGTHRAGETYAGR